MCYILYNVLNISSTQIKYKNFFLFIESYRFYKKNKSFSVH